MPVNPSVINLADLNGTNGFQISGEENNAYSGFSVSAAGDVNGDGFADLIIGAHFTDAGGFNRGASYVVFGRGDNNFGDGLGNLNLSGLTGANGFQISGEENNAYSGRSVSAAGDVNGDGFADLIIGAHYTDAGGTNRGASYVVFGRGDNNFSGGDGNLDLSELNATNGFQISGEEDFANSGFSVSAAGDVNGDGFADLVIGAYRTDAGGPNRGASYVIFGRGDNNFSGGDGNLDLSELSGANGFQINGEEDNANSGVAVSAAGDVNGDGFADLIIGANGADAGGTDRGASYVIFGRGDNSFGDGGGNFYLSGLSGANGFQISGEEDTAYSGVSVSAAGDVNGDGFADLIIGAHLTDAGGTNRGASYVVFGKASGFAANLNLSSLNGTNGFQISGEEDNARSGFPVSSAGDVNGDGFADLVIGAQFTDAGGNDRGASYVVYRRATGTLNRVGTDQGEGLGGGDWDDTLTGLGGNDRINAGAGDDAVSGGADNDTINGGDGDDSISGGSGNDTMDGGDGGDSLSGGSGNDTYTTDGLDVLAESAGPGTDTVNSTASLTLAANFEILNLLGAGNLNGTGNTLLNTITGNIGNNILNGGVDTLADQLIGLLGNDTYVLGASTNDVITDTGGIDTVTSTISRTLIAAIENLTLLGTAAINGTGNGAANVITGNAGKNVLNGATGIDTLIGGLGVDTLIGGDVGQDRFRFNALAEGGDSISNFDVNDFIQLKATAFLGLTTANKAANFVIRAADHNALDANDRLIFNQFDDTLWYDLNGSVVGGTIVKIADLSNNFNMTAADIVMV